MHGSTNEGRENDYRRMVEEVRRSTLRTPHLMAPHLRLWEVVILVQKFVEAVRRANAPRTFLGGSERDPRQRELLRRHREAHFAIRDPDIGLLPLLARLTNMDCTFVFGDAPCFGVNTFEWDNEIWLSMSRWAEAGFNLLFKGKGEEDWPRYLNLTDVEGWVAEGEFIKQDVLERMTKLLPDDGYPVVDAKRGVVKWRGETVRLCDGKKTKKLFQLFECLATAKGDPVPHEDICEALDYPPLRPDDTDYIRYERRRADLLRMDIHRLRVKLRASQVPQLADAIITTEPGCVRLDVSELDCFTDEAGRFVNSQEIPSFARPSPEKPGKSRKRKSP